MSRLAEAFAACFCTALTMFLESSSRAALVLPLTSPFTLALNQPHPPCASVETEYLLISSVAVLEVCSSDIEFSKSVALSSVHESRILDELLKSELVLRYELTVIFVFSPGNNEKVLIT